MPKAIGFDNEKYLKEQSAAIQERVRTFGNKLYLEFGGKLLYDYHAARVLPGFDPNVKMRLLQQLREQTDVLLCIYAGDIERKKVRADFGITYDVDALNVGFLETKTTEKLIFSLSTYKNKKYFSVRTWYQAESGEWAPTKKGVNLNFDKFEDFEKMVKIFAQAIQLDK
jgi:uncharacterized protein (UPF0371 family)